MHKNQNKKTAYFFYGFTGIKRLILWNIFVLQWALIWENTKLNGRLEMYENWIYLLY